MVEQTLTPDQWKSIDVRKIDAGNFIKLKIHKGNKVFEKEIAIYMPDTIEPARSPLTPLAPKRKPITIGERRTKSPGAIISLIDEVQGKSKLPSQINSTRKSAWVKQTQNPRQKKDALSRV
jgi:hypothetical protein